MIVNKIGDLIKKRALSLGYTQKRLGEMLNIDQRTVAGVFRATFMQTDRLERLCELLDYNFFSFYTRPGSKLEKFGYASCEDVRKENKKLKRALAATQKKLANAEEIVEYNEKLNVILKQTLEQQANYTKNEASRKNNKDKEEQ